VSRLTDPVYLATKAAVASSLAVILARVTHVPDALSSAFAALVCVTPTAYAGLRRGLEQLGGATLAGAVTALVLSLWPEVRSSHGAAGAVLLSVGLTAWACDRLRWSGGFTVAGFTALYLLLLPFGSFSEALRVRVTAVLVGVVSATVVNLAVSAVSSRAIRERRLRVTRMTLAQCFEVTSAACLAPTRRTVAADGWRPAFEALEELRADLAAQSHEVLLPQRIAEREAATHALRVADALADVAHLGRHVAFVLEGNERVESRLGEALSLTAATLASRATIDDACAALEGAALELDDAALASAAQRMSAALRASATPTE
jgi:Aromatic acid exporter family member 1